MATRLRGRPAHAPGPTFLAYTPNGKKLITVGLNGALRIFQHGSDDEPAIIDVNSENHTAVVAANDFFIVGDEAGSVTKYSLLTNSMDEILFRTESMPVRDLALSPDREWVAVASDSIEVKIINVRDMTRTMSLREHSKPIKHVSYDVSGRYLAAACSDGLVYVYSISTEQPQLVKRVDGIIKALETDSEASSAIAWHPDARAFAAPTSTRDIQCVASNDWSRQKAFSGGHRADISALAWSPNGALLATADVNKSLCLWETRTQRLLKTYDDVQNVILTIDWHPTDNVLSYTNNNGELFIREDFVPNEHAKLLRGIALQAAPMVNEPLGEVSGNAQKQKTNGFKPNGRPRDAEDEYLDGLLGPDAMSQDGADFIEDDDGAGYAEVPNGYGKRTAGALDIRPAKRPAPYSTWQPQIHQAFQPGSTPWKGSRRYLCLNLTGVVWTVDLETHHSVNVEYYDNYTFRNHHFTDAFKYDKACLNEQGALFSCPPSGKEQPKALLYWRPYSTWTTRPEWRTPLPAGEKVTSMSLSDSCIVVTTSTGYVRIYSLFGVPIKVYRQKSTPAVTCASWRGYVMTVGNGPVAGDGTTRLLYTIENVKRDETYQSEDILPLPEGTELRSVFFSEEGDPCIYDTDGVLLILLHWRTTGQAKWVPILDTRTLERLQSGKKDESYWPVAVAGNKFHCIILKGGEEYPYFPRPLLSDFEFRIPVNEVPTAADIENDKEEAEKRRLEETFVRNSIHHSLLQDMVDNTNATRAQRDQVPMLEREVDKALLQLFAAECREGEDRGMKALEIARLMRDRTGKMMDAARKVAARFQRGQLAEKLAELEEQMLVDERDD